MTSGLRVGREEGWRVLGEAPASYLGLANDYLAYLEDRHYSPATVRAYAFDFLHFGRWLVYEGLDLDGVDTDALLRYLAASRTAPRDGQHDNVVSIRTG